MIPIIYDPSDIDRRQAYLHLREAEQALLQASLYLTAGGRPTQSNEAIDLRSRVLGLIEFIEVPGD